MPITVKKFYKGVEGKYKELYGVVIYTGEHLIYTSFFAIKTGKTLEDLLYSNYEVRNKHQTGDIIIRRDLKSIYVNGFGFVNTDADVVIVDAEINEKPENRMIEGLQGHTIKKFI